MPDLASAYHRWLLAIFKGGAPEFLTNFVRVTLSDV